MLKRFGDLRRYRDNGSCKISRARSFKVKNSFSPDALKTKQFTISSFPVIYLQTASLVIR